jgi:hypothetical protein
MGPHPNGKFANGHRGATLMCALAVLALTGCGESPPSEPEEILSPTAQPTDSPVPEPTGTSPVEEPSPSETPAPTSDGTEGSDSGELADLLTEANSGETVILTPGQEVPLRLDGAWEWSEPTVQGDAVTLSPVDYFADPGFVEWLILGEAAGEAQISASGEPACGDEAACPPIDVELVIEVRG